jgi:hypothetical protein
MESTNWWEFKKCGREVGGSKVKELGFCPALLIKAGIVGRSQGHFAAAILHILFVLNKILLANEFHNNNNISPAS